MKQIIPIFLTTDDNYIPCMAVCLESIKENISSDKEYIIKIIHTNISSSNQELINKFNTDNLKIEFVNVSEYVNNISKKLHTRDYYTSTTYFRLFLPDLYPEYKKIVYIDCDTVLLTDIAELYNIDLEDNLLGAVPDEVIETEPVFQEYVEKVVGVSSYKNYFNAGVLLMNLEELRKNNFQEKFLYLLDTVKYSVVQDQDYLNRICKGRVKIIDSGWDVMTINCDNHQDESKIKLIHYNLTDKPWHYTVPFENYFWKYAKNTEFYDYLMNIKNNYSEEQKISDKQTYENLKMLAQKESSCVGDDRK